MKPYTWTAPRYYKGQRVEAQRHDGQVMSGVIMHVETNYDFNGGGAAWHLYAVRFDGWQRRQHLAENKVLRALTSAAADSSEEPSNG